MSRELPTGIVWRGRKAYVRVRIPEDVKHAFGGRAELQRSLGTSDEKVAKRLGRQKLAELESDWQRIRDTVPAPAVPRELSEADIHRHAAALYDSELRLDADRRANMPGHADQERVRSAFHAAIDPEERQSLTLDLTLAREQGGVDRTSRAKLLAELKRHLGTGETTLVQWAADAAIARGDLVAPRGGVPYRRLCQGLTRAWIEAIERTLERDRGDFTGRPADVIVTAPPSMPYAHEAAGPGEDILKLYDQYAAINPRAVKPDTLAYGRTSVKLFVESLPKGTGVRGINKAAVRNWQGLMRLYPVKAGDFLPFRGLDIRHVIEANRTHGKPVIIRRTINKALTSLSSFCRWLEQQGHIDSNPVTGFHEVEDESSRKIRSYTDAELQKLFASPLFTGNAGEGKEHMPGPERSEGWRYWLPWMALYTGARLGELAQLHVADIRQQDGHWLFHLTKEGGGKSLKTRGSQRIVPIHPELVRLGLLRFHADQQSKGHERLFAGIELDTRGFWSGAPSRFFRSYFARIGLKQDKSTNFHSFRHCVADAFRRAGYLDHQFGFLLGHGSQATKITRGYGSLREGDLKESVKMISLLQFDKLTTKLPE